MYITLLSYYYIIYYAQQKDLWRVNRRRPFTMHAFKNQARESCFKPKNIILFYAYIISYTNRTLSYVI